MKEAVELAVYIRDLGYMPEQVQDFYPTPSTLSTVMYYTGIDPRDMKKVYVERNPHRKAMQRALIQYRDPKNYDLVKEALLECKRTDLIGYGKECLIPPRPWKREDKRDGKVKRDRTERKEGNRTKTNKRDENKRNPEKKDKQRNKRGIR